jgi:hypothetical protein
MKQLIHLFILAALGAGAQPANGQAAAQTTNVISSTNTFIGWQTNGAAIFRVFRETREWRSPFPTNSPVMATNPAILRMRERYSSLTNLVFAAFRPESLNHLVWTNFVAHTNGRELIIWSQRLHPPGWPTNGPPVLAWNPKSLVWGLRGFTALSPCWQGEGSSGQVPITLLTRRHGYTRGHGMGAEGFNTRLAGRKVWFVAADNSLVTATVRRGVVRTGMKSDYTMLLFDRDLPEAIQPLRVALLDVVLKRYYPQVSLPVPLPLFKTEQLGNVSSDVPPLVVETWKGGDSGSPNLLPMPGELVFISGRSTAGPSAAMQEDMDELSKQEGLNPARYQLQWVDLSNYPDYSTGGK